MFAPVAGHLARYVRPDAMASPIDDALPAPDTHGADGYDGIVEGRIVHVDHFGNLITNIPSISCACHCARRRRDPQSCASTACKATYGAGSAAPVAVVSSLGLLEIAVPGGSADNVPGCDNAATPFGCGRRDLDIAACDWTWRAFALRPRGIGIGDVVTGYLAERSAEVRAELVLDAGFRGNDGSAAGNALHLS